MESMIARGRQRTKVGLDNVLRIRYRKALPYGGLVFVVGRNLAKKACLRDGDRVDIRWDPEDGFAYISKDKNGVLLRETAGKKGHLEFFISRKPHYPLPQHPVSAEAVTVNGAEEILFEFPQSTLKKIISYDFNSKEHEESVWRKKKIELEADLDEIEEKLKKRIIQEGGR